MGTEVAEGRGGSALATSPAVWIATVAGVGFAPLAPGTAGSAVAVVLFAATARLGLAAHLALSAAIGIAGVWAAGASERAFGRADDGRIVVDEVAGQLVALTPLVLAPLAWVDGRWPVGLVTAFVAFRVFDIAKPGPVRWAERRFAGGLGVMADDIVAGALAALVVAATGLALELVFAVPAGGVVAGGGLQ